MFFFPRSRHISELKKWAACQIVGSSSSCNRDICKQSVTVCDWCSRLDVWRHSNFSDRLLLKAEKSAAFFLKSFYLKKEGWRILEKFCRTCSLLGVEFSHGSGALRGVRLQQVALSVTLSYQISWQGTLGTDSVWVLKRGVESVRSGLKEDLQIIFVCQVLCPTVKVQDQCSWHLQKL